MISKFNRKWIICKKNWFKVKNTFNSAVEFLKRHGIYEPLVRYVKNSPGFSALSLCTTKFSEETCKSMIEFVKDAVNKNIA